MKILILAILVIGVSTMTALNYFCSSPDLNLLRGISDDVPLTIINGPLKWSFVLGNTISHFFGFLPEYYTLILGVKLSVECLALLNDLVIFRQALSTALDIVRVASNMEDIVKALEQCDSAWLCFIKRLMLLVNYLLSYVSDLNIDSNFYILVSLGEFTNEYPFINFIGSCLRSGYLRIDVSSILKHFPNFHDGLSYTAKFIYEQNMSFEEAKWFLEQMLIKTISNLDIVCENHLKFVTQSSDISIITNDKTLVFDLDSNNEYKFRIRDL